MKFWTVTSLGDDDRFVVVSDGLSEVSAPCLSSYASRAVGDKVAVVQQGKSWLVLGAIKTPASAAGNVTVSAVNALGWSPSTVLARPQSGAPSADADDLIGAWFYGAAIADACTGHTGPTMQVKIARAAFGGIQSPAYLMLGLHASTGLKPIIDNVWAPGVSLSRSGAAWIDVPPDQRDLLASGDRLGVAVCGTGPAAYAVFTTAADIAITF